MAYVYGRRNLREGYELLEDITKEHVEFTDVRMCTHVLKKIVNVFRNNIKGSKGLKSMRDLISKNKTKLMADIYNVTESNKWESMNFELEDHAKGLVIEYCNRFVRVRFSIFRDFMVKW